MSTKKLQDKSWKFAGHCMDGDRFLLGNVNVWSRGWEPIPNQYASIKDPLYQQDFSFPIYTIQDGANEIVFAAGEFSNNVWGFYTPSEDL